MRINCDLGEGLDDIDEQVMPLIDMANIACGGHTGNEKSMRKTVKLAKKYRVSVGAHPSYPDKTNFGRKSLAMPKEVIVRSVTDQISNLKKICDEFSISLDYIKPHGALYNDLLVNKDIFNVMVNCAQTLSLPLMIQSTIENEKYRQEAQAANISLIFEAFADRSYTDSGYLVPRCNKNAVHTNVEIMAQQARSIASKQGLYSENNKWIHCEAQSICVHSDTTDAIGAIRAIKKAISKPLAPEPTENGAKK